MPAIKIQIYSDYICPFCFLGKAVIHELEKEFPLNVEWLPFELHPNTPAEGMRWDTCYTGMNYENFFNNVVNRGKNMGISINITPHPLMYNSHLALQAGEFAKEHEMFDSFHEAMFDAYFHDGLNIGSIEIIVALARRTGLDSQALEAALHENIYAPRILELAAMAKEKRISSAPTFEIAGCEKITGPKAPDVFRAAFQKLNLAQL